MHRFAVGSYNSAGKHLGVHQTGIKTQSTDPGKRSIYVIYGYVVEIGGFRGELERIFIWVLMYRWHRRVKCNRSTCIKSTSGTHADIGVKRRDREQHWHFNSVI
jgi:hypothetical protein